jgi:integrase
LSPTRGGSTDLPLFSFEIDGVLEKASDVSSLPAEFMAMVRASDPRAKEMFLAVHSLGVPVVIPFHCEFHWLAACLRGSVLQFADSDPAPRHFAWVEILAKTIESWIGFDIRVHEIPVPRQPAGSAECGVHTTVNCFAFAWGCLTPSAGFLSYGPLRPLLKRVASSSTEFYVRPNEFFMAARSIAHRGHLRPFPCISKSVALRSLNTFPKGAKIAIGFINDDGVHYEYSDVSFSHVAGGSVIAMNGDSICIPKDTTFVADDTIYSVYPERLAVRYSPKTNSDPYGVLPEFFFAPKGAAAPSILPYDSIKSILKDCRIGDSVSVSWLDERDTVLVWNGVLTKRSVGVWSVTYDDDDSLVHGILPNPDVRYISVSVVPTSVPVSDQVAPTSSPPAPVSAQPHQLAPPSIDVSLASSPPATTPPVLPTPTVSKKPTAKSLNPKPLSPSAPPPASVDSDPVADDGVPATMDPSGLSPETLAMYKAFQESKNAISPGSMLNKLSGESMTAAELLDILRQPEVTSIAPLYRHLLAWSTSRKHLRLLRWLLQHLSPSSTPLDEAIPTCVAQVAAARSWRASSWHNMLVSIQGALALLFMYRSAQTVVILARCPRWNAHLQSIAHLMPLEQPLQPLAVTLEQVLLAISKETRPVVRAAIELAWLAAARGSDIRQLLAADIKLKNDSQTLTLTFRRGKTTKNRQYTVGVPFPSQETLSFLTERQKEGSWAFPGLKGEDLKVALRRVHPDLEQRSLRRGRLQHLSINEGWSDEQLRELSCHASVLMLRRYLDMGVVSATTLQTAVRAGPSTASSPAAL